MNSRPARRRAVAPAVDGATPARRLTAPQYQQLATVPPEAEWFANIRNAGTRRIYQSDVRNFMSFVGVERPEEFRTVRRAHVVAWREDLERRGLRGATIRGKLAALSSLFQFLCSEQAVLANPVKGVARPRIEGGRGKTPALSDAQVRRLLAAPTGDGLKARRDRAILAVLFFHALRRAELCAIRVRDIRDRRGVKHFKVHGKGEKLRYVPVHPPAADAIADYLEAAGHGDQPSSPVPTHRLERDEKARGRAAAVGRLPHDETLREAPRHERRPLRPARRASHGCRKCPRPGGRHRDGPGMARPCEREHDPGL